MPPCNLGVVRRDAPDVGNRACPAQNFFDRRRHQRRVTREPRTLVGMLDQRKQTAGDRIARGFESADDVQKSVMEKLQFSQLLTGDLRIA